MNGLTASVRLRPGVLRAVWADGELAFNPASGDLHLFDPLGGAVLDLLTDRWCDVGLLCSELADSLGSDIGEVRDYVERFVARLDDLGLTEGRTGDVAGT